MQIHQYRINWLLPLIITITGLMMIGCEPLDDPEGNPDESIPRVIMITNPDSFHREQVEIDPVTITDRYISQNILTMNVSYSDGCAEHSFRLYSTEPVYFGNSGTCDLYLSHDGHGDVCETSINQTIQFDLSPIGEDATLKVYPFESEYPIYPLLSYEYHD